MKKKESNKRTPQQIVMGACYHNFGAFFDFVMEHQIIAKGRPYIKNWHIDYLCAVAQETVTKPAISERLKQYLICNIPPRHTKSLIFSVALPAWYIGRFPHSKVLCIAQSASLNNDFAEKTQDLVNHPFYLELFPQARIKCGGKLDYITLGGGGRTADTIRSNIIGKTGDLIIIDDPDDKDVRLETHRERTRNFITGTAESRAPPMSEEEIRAGAPNPALIIVQQRMHRKDASGQMLERIDSEGKHLYKQVKIPLVAEKQEDYKWKELKYNKEQDGYEMIEKTYTRHIGEPVSDHFMSQKERDRVYNDSMKNNMGEVWSTLYQQNPILICGTLFEHDWYKHALLPIMSIDHTHHDYIRLLNHGGCRQLGGGIDCKSLIRYVLVDFAYTAKKGSDYSAIIVVGFNPSDKRIYILDFIYDQTHYSETALNIVRMAKMYSAGNLGSVSILLERDSSTDVHIQAIKDAQGKLGGYFVPPLVADELGDAIRGAPRPRYKYDKIAQLRPLFHDKRILMPESIYHRMTLTKNIVNLVDFVFEREYMHYPLSREAKNSVENDDFLDALSLVCQLNIDALLNRSNDYVNMSKKQRSSSFAV